MKTLNQAFVLAIITLMSASAFAADGVGEKKDGKDCTQVANKDGDKAKKASNVKGADEEKKDAKAGKAE
jgi:uncharacterized protein YdeI (BOF family)